jgi:hypothetical protein
MPLPPCRFGLRDAASFCYVGLVIAKPETRAFDRGVRPVLKIVPREKAREIVRFRPDRQLRQRIGELAEKSTEGLLSDAERAEYAGYVRANKFVAILQRQIRQLMADTHS